MRAPIIYMEKVAIFAPAKSNERMTDDMIADYPEVAQYFADNKGRYNPKKYHSYGISDDTKPYDRYYHYQPRSGRILDSLDVVERQIDVERTGEKYGPYVGGVIGALVGAGAGAIAGKKIPMAARMAIPVAMAAGGAMAGKSRGGSVANSMYRRHFGKPEDI